MIREPTPPSKQHDPTVCGLGWRTDCDACRAAADDRKGWPDARPEHHRRYEELYQRHELLRSLARTPNQPRCPALDAAAKVMLLRLVTLVLTPETRELLLDALAPGITDIVLAVTGGKS